MPFGDRTEALFALVLLRRVQQKRTGTQAPLCREMLGLETKAAAFPELSLMQQWWHRWLGCGISMGVAGGMRCGRRQMMPADPAGITDGGLLCGDPGKF